MKGSREDITFATRSARRFPSGLRLRPSRSLGSRREWSIASSLDFVGIYLVRLSPMIPPTADFVWSYSESVRARVRRGFNSPTFAPGCNECSLPLEEMSVRSAWVSFCCCWRRHGFRTLPTALQNVLLIGFRRSHGSFFGLSFRESLGGAFCDASRSSL